MTREKKVYIDEDLPRLRNFVLLYKLPNHEQRKKNKYHVNSLYRQTNAEDARIGVKGLRETACNTEY